MKKVFILSVFIMMVSNLFAHPEGTYYLYGEVEGREIAMVVDRFGEVCLARYCDLIDKYDHMMEGDVVDNTHYILSAYSLDSVKNEKVVDAVLDFKQREDHSWKGTWTNKEGQVEQVLFERLEVDNIDHPYKAAIEAGKINPYAAYRTKDIELLKKKKQKVDTGIIVRWYLDESTGIEMFRVDEKNEDMPKLDSINNILIADHLKAIN